MACACGLRGDHFACTQCDQHAGVKSLPCVRCRGFRFTAVPAAAPKIASPSTEEATTAPKPMQPQPQPATQRRARSARA